MLQIILPISCTLRFRLEIMNTHGDPSQLPLFFHLHLVCIFFPHILWCKLASLLFLFISSLQLVSTKFFYFTLMKTNQFCLIDVTAAIYSLLKMLCEQTILQKFWYSDHLGIRTFEVVHELLQHMLKDFNRTREMQMITILLSMHVYDSYQREGNFDQ